MEEQLQELNRKFSARIGQGTVALTQANGGLASGKFPSQVGTAHMADMGELAASIAHDFNNILSIVQAYAALIVSSPTKPKDVIEHAEVIKETVEKGVMLARQLVGLGRKTETQMESANINDLLHRMVKLLTPMFPTTIVIAEDLDACVLGHPVAGEEVGALAIALHLGHADAWNAKVLESPFDRLQHVHANDGGHIPEIAVPGVATLR